MLASSGFGVSPIVIFSGWRQLFSSEDKPPVDRWLITGPTLSALVRWWANVRWKSVERIPMNSPRLQDGLGTSWERTNIRHGARPKSVSLLGWWMGKHAWFSNPDVWQPSTPHSTSCKSLRLPGQYNEDSGSHNYKCLLRYLRNKKCKALSGCKSAMDESIDRLTCRPTSWPSDLPTYWPTDRRLYLLTYWLTDQLPN